MLSLMVQALDGAFLLATVASVVAWTHLIRTRARRQLPLLPPRSREEPYWTMLEFFLAYGLLMICIAAAAATVRRHWPVPEEGGLTDVSTLTASAWAGTLVNLAVVACLLVQMGLFRRETLQRAGLWPSGGDVRLGLWASLLILPPVLWLAKGLEWVTPYEHDVFKLIERSPDASVLFAVGFSAVIVAPLCEEFVFRMLLQGGAERLVRRARLWQQHGDEPPEKIEQHKVIPAEELSGWSWGPLWISSVTFALMHSGQGAAPIALFFFGVGVGYLYRQTGRLWPCIVVHFVLNALSISGFLLNLLAKPAAG